MKKNIFATVLTYPAPSANYRGEAEENRTIIQKVTDGRFEYAIISPEAMRNALREMLRSFGLPSNRERLHNEDQLAVKFADYPDAGKYADDFFFGYLMALDKKGRTELEKAKGKDHPFKRDSILRMNLAKALAPYRHDAIFTQSPVSVDSPWKNADKSALLHRETSVTAFQYPFAINLNDVLEGMGPAEGERKQWLAALLRAISELSDVAGNHARSLFHMAPASVVVRLTERLVPGYDSYGFCVDDKGNVSFHEVIDGIKAGDYPGGEFHIGGTIVKQLEAACEPGKAGKCECDYCVLKAKGAHLHRMADQALAEVCKAVTGHEMLPTSGK